MPNCEFTESEIYAAIGSDLEIAQQYNDRASAVKDHLLSVGMNVTVGNIDPCECGRDITLWGIETTIGGRAAELTRLNYLDDNPMVPDLELKLTVMRKRNDDLYARLNDDNKKLRATSEIYESRIDQLEGTIAELDDSLASKNQSNTYLGGAGLVVLAFTLGMQAYFKLRSR
jgi:hypothetical protein